MSLRLAYDARAVKAKRRAEQELEIRRRVALHLAKKRNGTEMPEPPRSSRRPAAVVMILACALLSCGFYWPSTGMYAGILGASIVGFAFAIVCSYQRRDEAYRRVE